jgi:hypothetical protein
MLATSFFSLIGPGLHYAREILPLGKVAAAALVLASVLVGGFALTSRIDMRRTNTS